tara:strand:- start:2608 stop:2820 length:213 start_codon:yes stop_codon:yes gene_type:complete
MAILKEIQYDFKDYMIFIDVGYELVNVSVYHYYDDNFRYNQKFSGYDVDDIKDIIETQIDCNAEEFQTSF